jgi:hypothetical protein
MSINIEGDGLIYTDKCSNLTSSIRDVEASLGSLPSRCYGIWLVCCNLNYSTHAVKKLNGSNLTK